MASKLEELKQYTESTSLNQSFLKGVIINKVSNKPPTIKTLLGSYTDTVITLPEHVDDLYVVEDVSLTDTQYKILHKVVEYGEWTKPVIQQAINEIGYYNNRHKDDVNLDKRIDEFLPFENIFNTLVSGKTYIDTQRASQAMYIANYLFTDKKTERYFKDVDFQVPLYWEYNDVQCKGLLDMLYTDSYTQVRDIKITESSLLEWKKIARRFRCDWQMSYYAEGVHINFPLPQANPLLIVYSTTDNQAEVFELTDVDLHIGKFGCERKRAEIELIDVGRKFNEIEFIYGWNDAIEIYKQAKELGKEDYNIFYNPFENKPLNLWL